MNSLISDSRLSFGLIQQFAKSANDSYHRQVGQDHVSQGHILQKESDTQASWQARKK